MKEPHCKGINPPAAGQHWSYLSFPVLKICICFMKVIVKNLHFDKNLMLTGTLLGFDEFDNVSFKIFTPIYLNVYST